MSQLKISSIQTLNVSGNTEFSARKVRATQFGGLMDPVIGFDHFQLTTDPFGAHPHAGMSALSYLFDDSAPYHSLDSRGNNVVITPGSLLWTWAGSGVVHTEFPVPEGARVNGLQVFISIPGNQQLQAPKSIYIDRSEMPLIVSEGVKVKIVTGETGTQTSPVTAPNPTTILHIYLTNGKSFTHQLSRHWNATIYTLQGQHELTTKSGKQLLHSNSVIALGDSDKDEELTFSAYQQTELILISSPPLHQPIFSSGAMSMDSAEKLEQALSDYKRGKMGFVKIQGSQRDIILPTGKEKEGF